MVRRILVTVAVVVVVMASVGPNLGNGAVQAAEIIGPNLSNASDGYLYVNENCSLIGQLSFQASSAINGADGKFRVQILYQANSPTGPITYVPYSVLATSPTGAAYTSITWTHPSTTTPIDGPMRCFIRFYRDTSGGGSLTATMSWWNVRILTGPLGGFGPGSSAPPSDGPAPSDSPPPSDPPAGPGEWDVRGGGHYPAVSGDIAGCNEYGCAGGSAETYGAADCLPAWTGYSPPCGFGAFPDFPSGYTVWTGPSSIEVGDKVSITVTSYSAQCYGGSADSQCTKGGAMYVLCHSGAWGGSPVLPVVPSATWATQQAHGSYESATVATALPCPAGGWHVVTETGSSGFGYSCGCGTVVIHVEVWPGGVEPSAPPPSGGPSPSATPSFPSPTPVPPQGGGTNYGDCSGANSCNTTNNYGGNVDLCDNHPDAAACVEGSGTNVPPPPPAPGDMNNLSPCESQDPTTKAGYMVPPSPVSFDYENPLDGIVKAVTHHVPYTVQNVATGIWNTADNAVVPNGECMVGIVADVPTRLSSYAPIGYVFQAAGQIGDAFAGDVAGAAFAPCVELNAIGSEFEMCVEDLSESPGISTLRTLFLFALALATLFVLWGLGAGAIGAPAPDG